MMRGLGRRISHDDRDLDHLFFTTDYTYRRYKYWWSPKVRLDQGRDGACVGFAWSHWLNAGPTTHAPTYTSYTYAFDLYKEAQRIDEWPGENYDGTSVRAGAKVLQQRGLISGYRWAYDITTLIDTLMLHTPVVVGAFWSGSMFEPNKENIVRYDGRPVGGHAWLCDGVNLDRGLARIFNSWGREWGYDGKAFIPLEDMERLVLEDGEVCIAAEANKPL